MSEGRAGRGRERGRAVRRERRTWRHGEVKAALDPPGYMVRQDCGCWWDTLGARIWEPCMAHEGEGHLSVISVYETGGAVARCLAGDCGWTVEVWTEYQAVAEAQQHWVETRRSEANKPG